MPKKHIFDQQPSARPSSAEQAANITNAAVVLEIGGECVQVALPLSLSLMIVNMAASNTENGVLKTDPIKGVFFKKSGGLGCDFKHICAK